MNVKLFFYIWMKDIPDCHFGWTQRTSQISLTFKIILRW